MAPLSSEHAVGSRIGNYELRGLIGAGGMGEVYRAYDARLGREVALKVLPPEFTQDPERLARFEREARALASINHANIAAIYGVEDLPGDGSRVAALVLELVEGETLAERIARGPLSIADALRIAGQLVDALDAAHEKGIVHRDLKPANIKLSPDLLVKVLDFGLAKTVQTASSAPVAMTMSATREGLIVGTPAYMSPDQTRGEFVDERTDVWAFGCVLFEMLTGVQAFGGATVSDTLAAVIERAPDWSRLPSDTPAPLRRLLRWTLEKDRRRRLRDIGDARVDLADALSPVVPATAPTPRHSRRVLALAGAAALVAAIAGGMIVWRLAAAGATPVAVARFAIETPAGEPLVDGGALAVSPDGRYVAFSTTRDGRPSVYLRGIDKSEARLVSNDADAAEYPFFSPDSQWIAFFSGRKLVKQRVAGGPPVTLADAPAGRGGSWADAGFIVFAGESRSFLSRVSADGGPVTQLTTLDAATETSHRFPKVLPGSRAVIFKVEGTGPDTRIDLYNIDTGQRRVLLKEDASDLHYTRSGHLLFRVGTSLLAAPFDLQRLELARPPALVQSNVHGFDVSGTGLLLYSGEDTALETLAWVDRQGGATPLRVPSRKYELPRLSPDGRRLVVHTDERNTSNGRSIWTYDLAREQLTRLTFDGWNLWPMWTSDGTRVVYASNRTGTTWDVFVRPADGSGVETPVVVAPGGQVPRDVSKDDLVVYGSDAVQGGELWLMSLDGSTPRRKFLSVRSSQVTFSPDARWIAYVSRESGREEVYIGRTDGSAGKWTASSGGGSEPRWNRNGRELFYRDGSKLLAVSVSDTTVPSFGPTQMLFENHAFPLSTIGTNYDVSADGQRFLMVMQDPRVSGSRPLQVVTGWFTELSARVPAP